MVALAAAAGVAIQNARLYEQAQRRQRWLRAAAEGTHELLSATHGDAALDSAAAAALQAAGADVCLLLTARPVDGGTDAERADTLTVRGAASRSAAPARPGAEVPLEVADSGAPGRTQVVLDPTLLPPQLGMTGMRTAVWSPLRAGTTRVGALVLGWHDDAQANASPDDVAMVGTFGEQLALAPEFAAVQADRSRLAVPEDRDRIARDLHDLVIQRLFAIGLTVQTAARDAVRPAVTERLEAAVDDLDDTIRDVRRTIIHLHGRGTPGTGLLAELESVISDARPALGFFPRLRTSGPLSAVAPDVAADLVAVVREALSNVARHARATQAQVHVSVGPFLQLHIEDDGVGVPPDPPRRSGLANMTERARRHGGEFSPQRRPQGGTRLSWQIP